MNYGVKSIYHGRTKTDSSTFEKKTGAISKKKFKKANSPPAGAEASRTWAQNPLNH